MATLCQPPTAALVPCSSTCAGWRQVTVPALPAGSGKTLAYLLPAFAHVLSSSSGKHTSAQQQMGGVDDAAAVQPLVLVLLPSRELAQQVHAQCTALFSVAGISTAVVYGGVPKEQQVGQEAQWAPACGVMCWCGLLYGYCVRRLVVSQGSQWPMALQVATCTPPALGQSAAQRAAAGGRCHPCVCACMLT